MTVVDARILLLNGPSKDFKWESTVCHGVDDDYSFCGALKGGKYEYAVFNRPMKFVLILVFYLSRLPIYPFMKQATENNILRVDKLHVF